MTPFTAHGPVDLLAVVPFVLGFHPEDSVVLMTFGRDAGSGLRPFHARIDLPVTADQRRVVADMLCDVVRRHGLDLVAVLVYSPDAAAARRFHDLLVPMLAADGIEILDALRVEEQAYYRLGDAEDPGTRYDLAEHPFTVEQVVSGRATYPNRQALAASLLGADDGAAEIDAAATGAIARLLGAALEDPSSGQVLELFGERARWLQSQLRALSGQERTEVGPCSIETVAEIVVLVSFEPLREIAWAEMTRRNAGAQVEFWRQLVRRAPEDFRAGAAGLLAFAAWLDGDGALAWCALDRCFAADPDLELGHHVAALLESATPPMLWAPPREESLALFRALESTDPDTRAS